MSDDDPLDRLHRELVSVEGWSPKLWPAASADYCGPDGMIASGDPEGLRREDQRRDEENRASLVRALTAAGFTIPEASR